MSPARKVDFVVLVIFGQLVAHVSDGEHVDARGDQRDHAEHDDRQAVGIVVERDDQAAEPAQLVK
jgi:hypothetical protein